MIHHLSRIPINTKDGATLFVFGDRQQGSPGYRREGWEQFRDEFKRTPNAWALGLGDYGDWLRPSLRPAITSSLAKDDSARHMLDNAVTKQHDEIIDEMDFLKGRCIGLHEGHHNWKFMNGSNTDQRLASALKAPYLGWAAGTRLVLEAGGKPAPNGGHRVGAHVHTQTIISTHGNANGRRVPAALSWMENNFVGCWGADLYLSGHGCKAANMVPFKKNTIRRQGPVGVDVQIPRVMVVGGFAEGWTNGWESDYVERNGMSPQPMSYGVVRFSLVKRKAEQALHGVTSMDTNSLLVETINRVLDL